MKLKDQLIESINNIKKIDTVTDIQKSFLDTYIDNLNAIDSKMTAEEQWRRLDINTHGLINYLKNVGLIDRLENIYSLKEEYQKEKEIFEKLKKEEQKRIQKEKEEKTQKFVVSNIKEKTEHLFNPFKTFIQIHYLKKLEEIVNNDKNDKQNEQEFLDRYTDLIVYLKRNGLQNKMNLPDEPFGELRKPYECPQFKKVVDNLEANLDLVDEANKAVIASYINNLKKSKTEEEFKKNYKSLKFFAKINGLDDIFSIITKSIPSSIQTVTLSELLLDQSGQAIKAFPIEYQEKLKSIVAKLQPYNEYSLKNKEPLEELKSFSEEKNLNIDFSVLEKTKKKSTSATKTPDEEVKKPEETRSAKPSEKETKNKKGLKQIIKTRWHFMSKKKKAIIIGAGIGIVAFNLLPLLAPNIAMGIMAKNSALWAATNNSALRWLLHAINVSFSHKIGGMTFVESTGIWSKVVAGNNIIGIRNLAAVYTPIRDIIRVLTIGTGVAALQTAGIAHKTRNKMEDKPSFINSVKMTLSSKFSPNYRKAKKIVNNYKNGNIKPAEAIKEVKDIDLNEFENALLSKKMNIATEKNLSKLMRTAYDMADNNEDVNKVHDSFENIIDSHSSLLTEKQSEYLKDLNEENSLYLYDEPEQNKDDSIVTDELDIKKDDSVDTDEPTIKDVSQSTDLYEIAEVVQQLNPEAEIRVGDELLDTSAKRRFYSSIPVEDLVLPEGFYLSDDKWISNKHNTENGFYCELNVEDLSLADESILMPKEEKEPIKDEEETVIVDESKPIVKENKPKILRLTRDTKHGAK